MVVAYVRAHQERAETPQKPRYRKNELTVSSRILVFDTETTIDKFQNLKVGFFRVIEDKIVIEEGYFYDQRFCDEEEQRILREFTTSNNIRLLTREEFIHNVFYHYVLFDRALCIGFNLPFDLSRLALRCTFTARNKRFHGGFSFQLSDDPQFPLLRIKVSDTKALIEFNYTKNPQDNYRGRFLDLHTFATALSGEKHLTLRRAGELFCAKILKEETDEHGKITEQYLRYLGRDVLATHSLYEALCDELAQYQLSIKPENIASSATLGKQLLRQLGIRPFMEQNPNFPKQILGKVMNAYYGGRSEVNIRHTPVPVSLLDVTSMYPSLNILMQLDKILLAEYIEIREVTQEIQEFLNNVTLESLAQMKDWSILSGIAELTPQDDALPIRAKFTRGTLTNIGICTVTSEAIMSYSVADLVASKLLTDKTPQILRATRFIPHGQQKTIRPVTVVGVTLDPRKRNIYLDLVRERQRIKDMMKSRARAIKIIINSNCYGIYIETNPEHHKSIIDLYGAETITVESVFEPQGSAYNPIIATATTAGARLIIAMIESLLKRQGHAHAFCDTDSMAVPVDAVPILQSFFQQLNPYGDDITFLKEEEHNVLCYGISAKRYVLYKKQGRKIAIIKKSLHGLGHLQNPFGDNDDWHDIIWRDILNLHYGYLTEDEFHQRYDGLYAVGKLSITTQALWQRVKTINNDKPYAEQVKPFNFLTVGFGTNPDSEEVKPIAPFVKNSQEAPHAQFIDASTGKDLQGLEYWQTLADTLSRYINHPESKLDGNKGILRRRKLHITDIAYCGKEIRNLDTQILKIEPPTTHIEPATLRKTILEMTPKQARERGISRQVLNYLKKRIERNQSLQVKKKTLMKLI